MRFAAKFGRLIVQVRPHVQEVYATGSVHVIQEGVYAFFKPQGLLPFERDLVLAHWAWNGSYQMEDEVTTVPPDYRIGVYDTREAQEEHAWSDELRESIEQSLVELQRYDYIIALPKTNIPAPWPNYDVFVGTVEELITKLKADGHDLQAVLEYEAATQNREPLLQALEEEINGLPVEEEILA